MNGVVFSRGDPAEFDHWEALGNPGWGWDALLPYFRRLETTVVGNAALRGRDGPIHVTPLSDSPDRLSDAFIAACREAGIPATPDYNGGRDGGNSLYEGVSYLQLSTRRGERSSTAVAYLNGSRLEALEFRTAAVATRVLFDGRRAVGIEYVQDGAVRRVRADREVIIAGGPIKSPQLLEVSGIGDAARLARVGIQPIHDLPGVGENLCDHLQSRITFASRNAVTLNEIMASPVRRALMGASYLLTRRGLMATPSCTVHALARSSGAEARPDVKIQLHHLSSAQRMEVLEQGAGNGLDRFPGFSIGFFQLRPNSRGAVHARSGDALEDPSIEPNYLVDETDQRTALAALKLARGVIGQPAMARFVDRETRPGIDVRDDAGLLAYIRQSGQTSFHPVGTCRMGTDRMAVVDAELRVRGIAGLRVVDSSVMPTIPSSNTNAASIMVGEKAADLVMGARRARTDRATIVSDPVAEPIA